MTPSDRLQHVMEIRYQINLDAILKEQVDEQYDKQRSIADQILTGLLDPLLNNAFDCLRQ